MLALLRARVRRLSLKLLGRDQSTEAEVVYPGGLRQVLAGIACC